MGDKCSKQEPEGDKQVELNNESSGGGVYVPKGSGRMVESRYIDREPEARNTPLNNDSRNHNSKRGFLGDDSMRISEYRETSRISNRNRNFYEDDFMDGPAFDERESRYSYRNINKPETKNRIFGSTNYVRNDIEIRSKKEDKTIDKSKADKTSNIFFEDSRKAVIRQETFDQIPEAESIDNKDNDVSEHKAKTFKELMEIDDFPKAKNESEIRSQVLANRDHSAKKSRIRVVLKSNEQNKYKSEFDGLKPKTEPIERKYISTMDNNMRDTEFLRLSAYNPKNSEVGLRESDFDALPDHKPNVIDENDFKQQLPVVNEDEEDIYQSSFIKLPNGSQYKGPLEGNVPEGQGEERFNNGDIYKGEFKEGKAHGYGFFEKKDQFVYQGTFKDGKFEGNGKLAYANGEVFEGQFKRGKQEGTGVLKDIEGNVVKKGLWIDGEFNEIN